MARVTMQCGACGGAVRMSDTACPHCGAPLEFERGSAARGTSDRSAAPATPARRMEPWKFVVAAAAVGLVLVFLVMELERDHAPARQEAVQAPAGVDPDVESLRGDIARLEREADSRPEDAALLLTLANRLHDLGMRDPSVLPGAIGRYERYLRMQPGDPNARVDLGICYFELGRQDSVRGGELVGAAVREMRAVADADPRHQPAAFNLGVVHLYLGATDESNAWFRKAVAMAPETPLGKRAASLLEQHTFPEGGTR